MKYIQLYLSILLFSLVPGFYGKYTAQEKEALIKLKKLVKDDLYDDYMHRDEYLIPWLRNRKLDVNKAAEYIRENLKWRKDEKMDDALNEKFPQFEKDFRWDLETRDKEGRPVLLFPYSSWDVRKAALSGQIKELIRYMVINAFERPQVVARKEGIAAGTNSTQAILISDLGGYNLRQHACVRCLEIPLGYIQNYEGHYPQLMVETLAINTPAIFDPVVTLTRPFYSEHFGKTLNLLGPHKEEWKKYLDKIIDPKQLPRRYGGTNTRSI